VEILTLILLFIPIIAALLIISGAPGRPTGIAVSLFGLLATLALLFNYDSTQGGIQFVTSFPLIPSQGITFGVGVDGLSLTVLLLTWLVALAAFGLKESIEDRPHLYYTCLLFIAAGANAAFLSTDLFWFFVFHEFALIPTFLLIGIWGNGSDRQGAAWKVTIYLGLGSLILLAGIIALVQSLPFQTFDILEIQHLLSTHSIPAENQHWIFLLLLIGFGILVSLFPFHSWAPTAYSAAPTPAAMLHAGVLKKFGLYGLLRVALPFLPQGAEAWADLLLILLIGNLLFVGLATLSQKQFDLTLGYSSVMHMGYIFLGIAAANTLALHGSALLMLAHGLSIAALFAVCGYLRTQLGTTLYSELGGLVKAMPTLTLLLGFAVFASIGLPGFANFAGEIMILFGAFHTLFDPAHSFGLFQWTVIFALIGVVLSAVYMLRAYKAICFGEPGERKAITDLPRPTTFAVGTLIAALLLFGFVPQLILHLLPAETGYRQVAEADNPAGTPAPPALVLNR